MIPAPSRLRLLVAVVASVIMLSACNVARSPAAVVDGEKITDTTLVSNIKLFKFLAGLSRSTCGQAGPKETAAAACARFTLSNLIEEDLVRHYALSHDITVSDSSAADAIGKLETSLGGADKLAGLLKNAGLTAGDFHALALRLLLFGEVRRQMGADQISDTKLHQDYVQNKSQFTQLHARHILVKTKAEAEKIARQLTAKNFGDLAKKYSTDTQSAQNGGDLGTVPASQLDTQFVAAALALKPGEISDPVQTQFGWHLIMLISADVTPFDQARQQLLDQESSTLFDSWLRDQLGSADITVNPKYGRLDRATGQIVPITSTATGSPASPGAPSASPAA